MNGMSIETRIHEAIDQLTVAEKRAARGLLANYPTIGLAPVAEFARQSGASAATVLRFVARLGFRSYPEFQRHLRDELDERAKSPLQRSRERPRRAARGQHFLHNFATQVTTNIEASAAQIPASEFEAACSRLATVKHACAIAGGRLTDPIAAYLEAHLRILRPGVRRLDGRPEARIDQILDIRPGDTAVLFDIRRYDSHLRGIAEDLTARRAFIILITDEWISEISKYAKIVLPCRIGIERTWDANTAIFALVEALIARTTELCWSTASHRIAAIEGR
jgi:DNA-binding MurR/RpiR family transcriptional regulator